MNEATRPHLSRAYQRAEQAQCELPLLSHFAESDRRNVAAGVGFNFGLCHPAKGIQCELPLLSNLAGLIAAE